MAMQTKGALIQGASNSMGSHVMINNCSIILSFITAGFFGTEATHMAMFITPLTSRIIHEPLQIIQHTDEDSTCGHNGIKHTNKVFHHHSCYDGCLGQRIGNGRWIHSLYSKVFHTGIVNIFQLQNDQNWWIANLSHVRALFMNTFKRSWACS